MRKTEFENEISDLLQKVVEHFDKEDSSTRERQIRHYRRLKLYWNNFSQIYWSEVAKDYRIAGQSDTDDQEYYDKPVNVFQAFLQTIIAALSIQVPPISCFPDDADNPLDLATAKAGNKIAEVIYKHNNAIFLWLHGLYVHCTEGMVACYTYAKEDKSYGTYDKEKYEDEEIDAYVCPYCNERVPDLFFSNSLLDEFDPGDDEVDVHEQINDDGPICVECGQMLDPSLQKSKLIVPRLVGVTKHPKSRVCLEIYGGSYIKIANYAKKQEDTPYLIFSHETHYSNAMERYPRVRDHVPQGGWASWGTDDGYEQQGRLNTQYRGDTPEENVTIKCAWLRPAAFYVLEESQYKKLKKKFPYGAKVELVNNVCCGYEPEALDDHWTLTRNPTSDYLNHDPLGDLLTNLQDITNDLISLTLQTIEHGISQTWADPAVVDFQSQRQIEATPGTISPVKPQGANKSIAEAFHSSTPAHLTPELFNFYRIIQELGQFVSGALPSLFGGQQQAGSSRTASEYAMSKGMAMQRLQTPWKMFTLWWKDIFGKAIPLYMKTIHEDERLVEKTKSGNFINVFIRKADLDGNIGSIELEASEKLPITDEQQADMILQLMQLNNAEIQQALMDPENLPMLKKVIKIPDFVLPGEAQRQKEYEEINLLLNTEPVDMPPDEMDIMEAEINGQPPAPNRQPSVMIDMDVDDHVVAAAVDRSWLIGDAGRLAKIENPTGYENVLLHFKQHTDAATMMMAQQQMLAQDTGQTEETETSGNAPGKKPKQSEQIKGDKDARTPIN